MKIKNTLLLLVLTLSLVSMPAYSATDLDFDPPTKVNDLEVLIQDSSVSLSWSPSSDNIGVTGYKLFSSINPIDLTSPQFTEPTLDVDNVLTYTVNGLENGQMYYFTVKALDAMGNVSDEFADMVTATPQGGIIDLPTPDLTELLNEDQLHNASAEDDGHSPKMINATIEDKAILHLYFSEKIFVPVNAIELSVFALEEEETGIHIMIDDFEYYKESEHENEDKTHIKVSLMEELLDDTNYVVTITEDITDLNGNRVIYEDGDQILLNTSINLYDGEDTNSEVVDVITETTPEEGTVDNFDQLFDDLIDDDLISESIQDELNKIQDSANQDIMDEVDNTIGHPLSANLVSEENTIADTGPLTSLFLLSSLGLSGYVLRRK